MTPNVLTDARSHNSFACSPSRLSFVLERRDTTGEWIIVEPWQLIDSGWLMAVSERWLYLQFKGRLHL